MGATHAHMYTNRDVIKAQKTSVNVAEAGANWGQLDFYPFGGLTWRESMQTEDPVTGFSALAQI